LRKRDRDRETEGEEKQKTDKIRRNATSSTHIKEMRTLPTESKGKVIRVVMMR
jgi:hypothetical protein